MAVRFALEDVVFGNPIYALATMTAWTVDDAGAKTATKATLYSSPTSAATASNPQILDSEGKLFSPVYIEGPVVLTMSGVSGVDDHDSGVIHVPGNFRGDWATATVYYPGDIVRAGAAADSTGDILVVAQYHTSGTYATDVSGGELVLMIDVSGIAAQFSIPDPAGEADKYAVVNPGGTAWITQTAAQLLAAIGAAASAHAHGYLDPAVTDNLTVGYTTDLTATGNTGAGSWTPDLELESLKTATVDGSFTLEEPASGNGTCIVEFTNDGAGPHSPTIAAGYQLISGTWDDTDNAVNLVQIIKMGSNSYLSISQVT